MHSLFTTILLGVILFFPYPTGAQFQETFSPERITSEYGERPIRIMIVPGHDNEYSGTAFQDYREADLNLLLAETLFEKFNDNPKFLALTTRDFTTGAYTTPLENYFTQNREEILTFATEQTLKVIDGVQSGTFQSKATNKHNFAGQDVRVRLYGINKWANLNAIDIVLHIHFNDSPDRRWDERGEYSGFAIYIPEPQFPNARLSKEIAKVVQDHLDDFVSPSDHHLEEKTLIESQELIAIGSNASRDGASLLIEYSYMYEPHIMQPQTRELIVPEMAHTTYQAIIEYFEGNTNAHSTTLLPHIFTHSLKKGLRYDPDTLRLQRALTLEGLYPPQGKTIQECPVNGTFLGCTERAVIAFQEKYKTNILTPLGLTHGTGYVGPSTLRQLNLLYGF